MPQIANNMLHNTNILSNNTKADAQFPEAWTILKILSWTEGYFKTFDIDSPRLTAEILLCHSLKVRRIDLYLQFDRPLNKDELTHYKSLIKRRVNKEPVAYITGTKGFWNSQFAVTPDVLIPRPDTETLVETTLSMIKTKRVEQKNNKPTECSGQMIKVLELGTGSGAIAISIAKENPDLLFFATDISTKATFIASKNSLDNSGLILSNLFFIAGSWFSPIKKGINFDIIVSNPPYIPTNDIATLQQEIKGYEPLLALDGGQEGISCIKHIIDSASDYLTLNGVLLMEIGFDQKTKVINEALNTTKYNPPLFIKDYSGYDRVVVLTKR